MSGEEELRGLLPKMKYNEEYKKRQRYKYKKREEERAREMERVTGKKRPVKKSGGEAETAVKKKKKASKKEKAAVVTKKSKDGKKKTRAPKLKVASAETGKETLTKKKAREMVQASKKSGKAALKEAHQKTGKKHSAVVSTKSSSKGTAAVALPAGTSFASSTGLPAKNGKVQKSIEAVAPPALTAAERDRMLLARAIRGEDLLSTADGAASRNSDAAAFIRQDPSLYPNLEFLDDYAEKKHQEVVSADQLLQNAHRFFKDLGKREQALNRVAKERINHLRAVNKRGGDKDGFRYVVPKNVKHVVRELLSAQKAREGEEDPEALIDPQTLVSTFGGDGVAETSDKPVRRSRRHRSRTYSDFYQFQVSKKWTRNAENFLKRSRPNKMLFEAKKHQRSIKNF